jgi:TonB-linked SusC/RagA family outer membrane protein
MIKKLYVLFLTAFCTVFATLDAQNVTFSLDLENVSLATVFREIEKRSDYSFVFRSDEVNVDETVSVRVKEQTVEAILDRVLNVRGLRYAINGRHVTVYKPAPDAGASPARQTDRTVRGTVRDENGTLSGVTVTVKGTNIGVLTGGDGRYSVSVPDGDATLVFSLMGLVTQEMRVGGRTAIDVLMHEEVERMEEVVVVGYGKRRKSDLTGSLANVKADELALTAPSLGQALAGRIAGVQVSMTNGTPGAGAKIRVRGVGSLSAGGAPLYVVDGYPASEDTYINPEDVASIDVLKDAASAAIYGSRGAGGVVLITTKRGSADRVRIDYDYQYGVAQLERKIKLLDARQFRDLVIDARNNTYRDQLEAKGVAWDPAFALDDNPTRRAKGGTNQTVIADLFFDFDAGKPVEPEHDTDWQDAIYGNAPVQRHNFAIAGGNSALKYRVSAAYLDQSGIISPSNHKRLNLRANVDAQVAKRLKTGFNFSFSDVSERLIPDEGRFSGTDGIVQSALVSYPQIPVRNPDGSYAVGKQIALAADGYAQAENPVALAHEIDIKSKESRMNFNAVVSFEIVRQLSLGANLGTQYTTRRYNYYRPRSVGQNTDMPYSTGAISKVRATDITNYEVDRLGEFTLNYGDEFGGHRIEGLAGFTVQRKTYDRVAVDSKGHPDDYIHELTAHGPNPGDVFLRGSDTRKAAWSMLSALGRVNYAFGERFAASVSLRADGSSRFGPRNKWGWFPSVSAGWTVSGEEFYARAFGKSSALKLRASWGLSGNNNIGNYSAYQVMAQGGYPFGASRTVENAYWQNTFNDPAVGWEKTSQYNAGIDIGLFNNRVNLIGNYYYSLSYDLLYDQPISAVSGSTVVTTNLKDAKVRNSGFDLQVDSRILTGKFKWNLGANISVNRNMVLDMGGINDIYKSNERNVVCYVTKSGLPVGSFYGYRAEGIVSGADYANILI